MPDDINKSGRPVNGQSPVKTAIDKYHTGQEKESTFVEAMHESYGYPLEQELKTLTKDPIGNLDAILKIREKQEAYQRQEQRVLSSAAHKNKYALINSVSTAVGARQERSQISQHRYSAFTAPIAISRGTGANPFDVERESRELEGSISASRERMVGFAKKEDVNSLRDEDVNYQGLLKRKGETEAVQSFLSKSGKDVTSQYLSAEKKLEGFSKTGIPGGLGDAEKALRAFIEALKEGKEITTEEFEAKEKAIEQIEKHQERQQRSSQRMATVGGMLGSIGGAITSTGQRAFIGTQIEGQQVATQYANWENRKYDDVRNGVRNLDFGSMRRLSGQYGIAESYGGALKTRQNTVIGLGGAFAAAAETTLAAGAFAQERGLSSSGIAEGIGHSMKAGLQIANTAVELNAGVKGAQTGMMGRESYMGKLNAYAYVSDEAKNAAINYRFNLGMSTRGLGSGRNAVLNSFEEINDQYGSDEAYRLAQKQAALVGTSAGHRYISATQQLANAGINKRQAIALTAQAGADLGGEYNGREDLLSAGRAQKAGIVSAEEYIGLRGQMSTVGGGTASNMEKVLETAVAGGMNKSKNIKQMVDATVALARNSSALGVSVAGGTASGIGAITQALSGTSINQRVGVAKSAMDFTNRTTGDQSLNMFNVAKRSQLRKIGGIMGDQLTEEAAARLTPSQIRELRSTTDPTKRKELARKLGIGEITRSNGGFIPNSVLDQITDINQQYVGNMMFKGIQDPGEVERARALVNSKGFQERKKNGTLSVDEEKLLNHVMAAGVINSVNGESVLIGSGGAKGERKKIYGPTGSANKVEALNAGKATNEAIEVDKGELGLGGTSNVLKGTLDAITNINSKFEKSGISFFERAEKAGKVFDRSDGVFSESVEDFKKAVDKLLGKKPEAEVERPAVKSPAFSSHYGPGASNRTKKGIKGTKR